MAGKGNFQSRARRECRALPDLIAAELRSGRCWAYSAGASLSIELLSLSAIALHRHGMSDSAQRALDALSSAQSTDGSLGVTVFDRTPCWPTGLAVLAWRIAASQNRSYRAACERAVGWILSIRGETSVRTLEVGHDTTLTGWPWVLGSHAWVEPTAINVLALRAAGLTDHPRTREAIWLLLDRQLRSGGWNYGNTTVLGKALPAQLQPTGIALAAVAGHSDTLGSTERAIAYVEACLSERTPPMSLGYALLGLAAHNRWPANADSLVELAMRRVQPGRHASHAIPVLALAAVGTPCPLLAIPAEERLP